MAKKRPMNSRRFPVNVCTLTWFKANRWKTMDELVYVPLQSRVTRLLTTPPRVIVVLRRSSILPPSDMAEVQCS